MMAATTIRASMICGRLERRLLRLRGVVIDISGLYHPLSENIFASAIITCMRNRLFAWERLYIAIFSFPAAYSIACRWFDVFHKPLLQKISLITAIWFVIFILLRLLTNKWPSLIVRKDVRGKILFLSGLAALICLVVFHWQPPVFSSAFQIEISGPEQTRLVEVLSGNKTIPLDQFQPSGGWQLSDYGWIQTGTEPDRLTFAGNLDVPVELVFFNLPEQGSATITLQGQTHSLDLFAPLPDYIVFKPFPASLGNPSILFGFLSILLALCEVVLLTAVFYLLLSRQAAATLAAVVPMVFLLPYITTLAGHNVALGNDFGPFYYVYKTYLLDYLSNGHFLLWSPSEGAGYPFFSNPLAQAIYPFNLILAFFYKINGGYTRLDHQVYTVAAISWFSLGLYVWLRSLRVEKRHAVIAALTMALSYKMTELLRFTNAAHEAAWYPWILLALTKLFTTRDWKTIWRWSAGLCFSLICLFTAGYPYYVYYLPFLAAPYLVFMLIPRVRQVIFAMEQPDWRRFISGFLTASLAAVLICAPYLWHMSQTITQTSGRAGDDFQHATMYPFDFQDTLESLVYPTAARPEGWFYFGALGLALMTLYLAHPQKAAGETEPTGVTERRGWPVKAALLGWLVFLNYISYGEQSYLFLFFYKILPEFSALRGWGRLSIALLPGLSLLLAYALADFECVLGYRVSGKSRVALWSWLPLAAVTVFSLVFQWVAFSRGSMDEYWELYFIPRVMNLIQTAANVLHQNVIPDPLSLSAVYSYSYMAFSLVSGILVLLLLWKFFIQPSQKLVLAAGLGLFSLANLWYGGPWLWNNGFVTREIRKPGNYQRMTEISIGTPRKNEDSTLTLSPSFSVGSPPKWHFARYQDFYFQPENDTPLRDVLLGVIDGNRFFFSRSIEQKSIANFLMDAHGFSIEPVVHDYTGDHLLVDVNVPENGYLTFVDNWDENWIATVDGKPAKIERLFGTFKSVRLEAGKHEVSMAYCPRFFKWANSACKK